jgi:hypothetical protein
LVLHNEKSREPGDFSRKLLDWNLEVGKLGIQFRRGCLEA